MLTKHDCYCRCRICKPPLVGQRRRDTYAIWALGFLALVAAIMSVAK
jgi:hypothetical protein